MPESATPDIIIVAKKISDNSGGGGGGGGGVSIPAQWFAQGAQPGSGYTNAVGDQVSDQEANDSIRIVVEIDNLTKEQVEAIQKLANGLKEAIAALYGRLAADSYIQIPGGDKVFAAQLGSLLANASIYIMPAGTSYPNGSTRGETLLVGDRAVIRLNIDVVMRYTAHPSGGAFLLLHEVAHLTSGVITLYGKLFADGYTAAEADLHERTTNDIARAVLNAAGMPQFPAQVPSSPSAPGYSAVPLTFSSPGSSGDGDNDPSGGVDTSGGGDTGMPIIVTGN